MKFTEMENHIVNICNGIYGNLKTKQNAKYVLIKLLKIACVEYQINSKFKKDLDEYHKFLEYKNKYEG